MLMILFVHSLNEYPAYDSSWSRALMVPQYGYMGCSVFFFMSGFGLFRSLAKGGEHSTYLTTHLRRLLLPFLATFGLTYILVGIVPTSITQTTTNDITALFSLSLSCGIDMWFFKVTLANYIITILLHMSRLRPIHIAAVLAMLHIAFIAICYTCHTPGYWYCSNLAFPLGALVASTDRTHSRGIVTSVAILSLVLFGLYYLSHQFMQSSVPITIAGCLALCMLLLCGITSTSFLPHVAWLEYIGRQSLLYYLFSIPVMICIPCYGMHYLTYFAACTLTTTTMVWVWTKSLR